jgi:hypothetical protein
VLVVLVVFPVSVVTPLVPRESSPSRPLAFFFLFVAHSPFRIVT